MQLSKRSLIQSVLAASITTALAMPAVSQAADTIKIGGLATLEGAFAALGEDSMRGLKLALKEMNYTVAGKKIELYAEGGTYAAGNYDFVLSADGGICTQGSFGGTAFSNKYPPVNGSTYDRHGLGGFGGMGLIQLMAPPGRVDANGDDPDNTGTVLDNNIDCFGANSAKLTGMTSRCALMKRPLSRRLTRWLF